MITISGVTIARNAESVIADCLESISFCDECIVVDGGSTDRTVDIAKRMNARIILSKTNNFSEMRNTALKKARGKWILYVDADERADKVLAADIEKIIESSSEGIIVAYIVKRKNFYFGDFQWPYIEKLERLFRKEKLKEWRGELHETPIFEGDLGELNGYLNHYTHSDLSSMLKKTIEWSKIEASLRYQNGHPEMRWWRFPRVMVTAFWDSYIRQQGFKAGTAGLIESIYQAFSIFITYARLWEMQNKKAK